MELSWSTFVLEIINFLVLVWILKRFLYRPVTKVLNRRREKIEQQLDEATRLKAEASSMQQQYEGRLAAWEQEKQEALDRLHQEIQGERQRRLERLDKELAGEREKAQVVERRRAGEQLDRLQRAAHARGARFASRLLAAAAGAEVESRLYELFVDSLEQLDEARLESLRQSVENGAAGITITSAYPLADDRRQRLEQILVRLLGRDAKPDYREDPALLAGLRIAVGAWVLRLNLADELQAFAELADESAVD